MAGWMRQPDGSPSLAGARVFAALLLPASLGMAWFWMVRPVLLARQSGVLQYSMRGVLLPPALLYMAVALFTGDLRDGQIRATGADGKSRLTAKGWGFVSGLVAVLLVTLTVWWLVLRSLGFDAFSS